MSAMKLLAVSLQSDYLMSLLSFSQNLFLLCVYFLCYVNTVLFYNNKHVLRKHGVRLHMYNILPVSVYESSSLSYII